MSSLHYADVIAGDFESRGFKVYIERNELGFPYTPTFVCKRKPTTVMVELDSQVRRERLEDWVRFGRSCGRDLRLALCVPSSVSLSAEDVADLRQKGIGLYYASTGRLTEQVPPVDLGLNVQLPELESLPQKLRELLGSACEQFGHTHWREGFEDACQVLESEARKYLKRGTRSGRITIIQKRGSVMLSTRQINHMTMGRLATTFGQIQAQTHADKLIGQALATINKDRVRVAHFKSRAVTEKSLRSNVGQHLWTIVAALRQMI